MMAQVSSYGGGHSCQLIQVARLDGAILSRELLQLGRRGEFEKVLDFYQPLDGDGLADGRFS